MAGTVTSVVMCEKSFNCKDPDVHFGKPRVQATSASAVDSIDLVEAGGKLEQQTDAEIAIEEAARKARQHSGGLKIFSGNGNMALALEIGRALGINLGKATVGKFADGEVNIQIHENVRGKDCYIIQPTCPPVNDNMMELLLLVSTLSRASARRITVVIPYYGYARQDRKMQVSWLDREESFSEIFVQVCHSQQQYDLNCPLGPRSHLGCRCGASHGSHGH